MRYQIIIKPAAERSLDRLPRVTRRRIADRLEMLRDDPRPPGAVKLSGQDAMYRIRVGDYRVIYEIDDDRLIIFVLRVAHRKDAYRGM
jgi:mRNA interferase RelE/StbE